MWPTLRCFVCQKKKKESAPKHPVQTPKMALRHPASSPLLLRWRSSASAAAPLLLAQQLQRCFASTSAAATTKKPRSTSPRSVHHQRREFLNLETALHAFHRNHGHYAVPLRFRIPLPKEEEQRQELYSDDAWPEELRGMKLGTALSRFMKVADKSENAAIATRLVAMGIPVHSVDDWKRYLWDQVSVVSLQTFHEIHGHFLVPYAYTVPHGDVKWPRQTWGYKLGYWVIELRRDKMRLDAYQLRDLKAMKFVWNAREARWNQYFVPAMKKYNELHGKSTVPQSFVVPHDDDKWPKELHGYRLGQKVNNLRCGEQSGAGGPSEEMQWDDVELVYNNWFLLDILHEDEADGKSGDGGEGAGPERTKEL